jgi:hypothetical protein
MVDIIVGDYSPNQGEVVHDYFFPDIVYKKKIDDGKSVVLFADHLGLTKEQVQFIVKAATKNVKIVVQSTSLTSGLRQGKNLKIHYEEGNSNDLSPFALAAACLNITDRDYLFGFLMTNRPQMFMLIKALIGGMSKITKPNKQWVAWLDMHQWKVNPEILYAVIAHKIKPQPEIKFLPWLYPKKAAAVD